MKLNGIAIWAAFLLAGCAHSSVVLLPDEDGGHGEISIRPASGQGGETVMRDANSRANLTGAKPSIQPLGAKGLKPTEAALLASLPPPARSFTLYFHEGTTQLAATPLACSSKYAPRSRDGLARKSRLRGTRTPWAATRTMTHFRAGAPMRSSTGSRPRVSTAG